MAIPRVKAFKYLFNVMTALDIGCAYGADVKAFIDMGIEAYGVDVSDYAINTSLVKDNLRIVDIAEEVLPFPDESFDLVSARNVLEHIHRKNLPHVLSEISRVLRIGGLLYMIAESPTSPSARADLTHVTLMYRWEWAHMLRFYGLEPSVLKLLRLYCKIFAYLYNINKILGKETSPKIKWRKSNLFFNFRMIKDYLSGWPIILASKSSTQEFIK